jgi:hypothetical protein
MIFHEPKWKAEFIERAIASHSSKHIASSHLYKTPELMVSTFMRVDMPVIPELDQYTYILYTDTDVYFRWDVRSCVRWWVALEVQLSPCCGGVRRSVASALDKTLILLPPTLPLSPSFSLTTGSPSPSTASHCLSRPPSQCLTKCGSSSHTTRASCWPTCRR